MSYTATITYDNAASLSFNTSLVEVGGGTVRLKDLGGGTYSTARPAVTSQLRFSISALTAFSASQSTPAGSSVAYQVTLGTTSYWYSSAEAAWIEASSPSESNTAAEINTNASTLLSDLDLPSPQYFGIVFYLVSNGTARPAVTSNTLSWTWTNGNLTAISQCLIYAYLSDLLGDVPAYDADKPIKLIVGSANAFLNGSRMVLPFSKEAEFDSDGYAELSIIETTTPGIALEFNLSYYDGRSVSVIRLFNAIVPNQPTASINTLSTVVPYNFG